ncbi:FolC bifunctional protein [Dethiosulfovibrio peptidovorans DSM 11002]|uniref:tetrahydrofolate synthase n=1 Tax=Dethiosulfovibrio peptidovorans DSM 11002 TaxID=469381 RepID=D2Z3H0_9BACT|nr:folylpolyglutamate synthase/dihydrofolate synthase family protein [Dethiosulfovibrio peptidovorans]EFC92210.1 FolC bifunctional protein [Dethiosulfovibrio peptidovorans DSM 11002]
MNEKIDIERYDEIERLMTDLSSPGIHPGLDRVIRLLNIMGNPERSFPAIHVVGTNGKGSTSALIEAALRSSGYSTALYTSPHLLHFGERLTLNGECVSPEAWRRSILRIFDCVEEDPSLKEDRPTYFEIMTVCALTLISERSPDIAVIEAGMGGRLDATNVLGDVRLSVVTPIALDHSDFLGDTLEAVAEEKFAVIRDGGRAVFAGDGGGKLSRRFREICDNRGCADVVADEIIDLDNLSLSLSGTTVSFKRQGEIVDLALSLLGRYQADNARMAYLACDILMEDFPRINKADLLRGFSSTKWPGRLEVFRKEPPLLLDGAHNPHGMSALVASLGNLVGSRSLGVVYTSMSDKDYTTVLGILSCSMSCRLYCTEIPDNERCAEAEKLVLAARDMRWAAPPIAVTDPSKALDLASKECDIVVGCGSLYLLSWIYRNYVKP